jgi:hypothetical protein
MSCNNSNADFRPANYNIQIWQNNTWSQIFQLSANETPIDLTGAFVEIQVRQYPNSSTAVMTLDSNDNGIILGGVDLNQITINAPVTAAAGSYVYDMTILFPNENVKTYIWGNYIVYPEITQL